MLCANNKYSCSKCCDVKKFICDNSSNEEYDSDLAVYELINAYIERNHLMLIVQSNLVKSIFEDNKLLC